MCAGVRRYFAFFLNRMSDTNEHPTVSENLIKWKSCNLSELRSIVDTRVMEKNPIFDGNEANFAVWRFTFEATFGLLGLG